MLFTKQPTATSRSASKKRSSTYRIAGAAALIVSAFPAIGYVTSNGGSASAATGSVGGTVFRDTNLNGIRDVGEGVVGGVWVRAFGHNQGADGVLNTSDDSESAFGPVKSSSTGAWSITGVTSDDKVRVEFYGVDANNDATMQGTEQTMPSWLQSGPRGTNNASSVQFVALNTSSMSYGVHNPGDYCQSNPALAVSCMTLGSNTTYNQALVTMSSSLSGSTTSEATAAQIGATNGVAAGRDGNIYAATYVKRHTEYGSAGAVNAIYRARQGGSDTPSVFVTLPGTLPAHENTNYPSDDAIWAEVGKKGIGGIALSEDGTSLYAVNMGDQNLYTVPVIGTGATVTSGTVSSVAIAAPTPCDGPRPMSVAVKDGLVYVGGVCSAEGGSTADLDGYVMVYNPASSARDLDGQAIAAGSFGTTPVLRFDFSQPPYSRLPAYCADITNSTTCPQTPWSVWKDNDVWSDGPMLSGLAFRNGDLVVGIRKRLSDKTGNNGEQFGNNTPYQPMSPGDLLLACRSATGWSIETNGGCTSTTNGVLSGAGVGNSQGPGDGEFFADDAYTAPNVGNPDSALGSVAVVGSNVISTAFDPLTPAVSYTAGLTANSAADGSAGAEYELQGNSSNFFGKANGLGGIAVLCDQAPLEIGDRVWSDINGDGIQNPAEPGISGVTVRLFDASGVTLLGTAVTDTNGNYTFTNVGGTAATTDNLVDTLVPNTAYRLVIDTTQGSLSGKVLTTADAADATVGDNSDSDASTSGSNAIINFSTRSAGNNDHTQDFGFFAPYSLGNRVWIDADNDSTIDATEVGSNGRLVELLDNAGNPVLNGATPITTTTANGGYYRFDNLAPGRYRVRVTGPAGYVSSSTDALSADNDADATSSSASDDGVGNANTATSATITLGSAAEPLSESDLVAGGNPQGTADAQANMTLDFGFYQPIDLTVGITVVQSGPYVQGQDVDFLVTATNNGPAGALAGHTVTVRLPAGMTYRTIAADGTGWTITDTPSASEITLTNANPLAASASAPVINVHATIGASASSPLKVEAKVVPAPADIAETNVLGTANSGYETGDAAVGSNNDTSVSIVVNVTTTTAAATTTAPAATTTTLGATTTTVGATTTTAPGATTTTVGATTTTAPAATTTTAPGATTTTAPAATTTTSPAATTTTAPGATTTTAPATTTTAPATTTTAPAVTTTVPVNLTYSLGNRVWIDLNDNGVIDGSESGLDGVTVTLRTADNVQVGASQVTSNGGYYLFTLLPAGDYIVEISTPSGYRSSSGSGSSFEPAPDPDSNETDNDDNGTAVGSLIRSTVITLGPTEPVNEVGGTPGTSDPTPDAQSNLTVDFGLVPTTSLGDTVFFDEDRNGQLNGSEAGVANVTVRLLNAQSGAVVSSTTTDATGKYLFTGLTPGVAYIVEFVASTLPAGASFTTMGVGSPESDSNADPTTGRTMPVTLVAGQQNLTIDAGIIRAITTVPVITSVTTAPASTTTVPSATSTTLVAVVVNTSTTTSPTTSRPNVTTTTKSPDGLAVIGDYVWRDYNSNGRQDPNELPIAGAVVVLTNAQGVTRKSVTDSTGTYRFDGLLPGTYTAEIQSTSNPTNGPKARVVTVRSGDVYLDADFGFNRSGVQGVQIEQIEDFQSGLSVTGTSVAVTLAAAMGLLGLGFSLLSRRRRSVPR